MGVQLGIIADDFTGGTDIASFLVANGVKTIQVSGAESIDPFDLDVQAIVVSLKSRSNPVNEAVAQSLQALELLKTIGARQVFFKYCSTFDSTAQGNIGPVTDALLDALNEDFTVICPALPVNGRTTYQGVLFINGVPLNESGMRNHPVTPMTDSNLVRLMDVQAQGTTGLVPVEVVERGVDAVTEALAALKAAGNRYAVLDALNDQHLSVLGAAVAKLPLVTGGSGLGGAIARSLPDDVKGQQTAFTPKSGPAVILSGSCSVMTNDQVTDYKTKGPFLAVDVDRLMTSPHGYDEEVLGWFTEWSGSVPAPLIFATSGPTEVQRLQQTYGSAESSHAIEKFFGRIAVALVDGGVQRVIVAGGETSGSVTTALGITRFEVGDPIAPGVPWVRSLDGRVDLALKSGNFGTVDFFSQAQ
ncbi:3-oxo-tetronate kinase [Arthrobacter sp. H14-L1]|uniref:3-oxo-tetronate kinase n=1 Tax=Arthrobacter sp. H14-L1 TaxID=2996697 RepID=UPI0022717763|nr:3-oxo-tetronate kinase [Arthrobacter sp. H14-L1]MCY0906575.1 four-carbon acid sugar kinase family protein [Arthrobacter sp. H14-L1]